MTDYRADKNVHAEFDSVIQDIADYVLNDNITSKEAETIANYCLLDTIGCGLLALDYPACQKMLGPIVSGSTCALGAKVPGTPYQLDPVTSAFNIGAMIRWLDFNDTWLAAEWGHPSDNLGAILALADYISRQNIIQGNAAFTIKDVLHAMIKAHEIQGILALNNSFNRVGLDHVILVKVASTAVSCHLLNLTREQTLNALSLAWVDGQSLRTYRHAPNTGSRKSWAAGDATARGLWLALIAQRGEMGYPSVLTTPTWGVSDVLMHGKEISLSQSLGTYVMENILFKIAFPAEFHAQTAVEAAIILHPQVADRIDDIAQIEIETCEAGVRIISKVGPLHNPADRDHCLQYMVAIGLLYGGLTAQHYEDNVACDPRIDALRDKMRVKENLTFSQDYMDPQKRAIGNSVQIIFNDNTQSEKIRIDFPVGHRTRRAEGIPLLLEKFNNSVTNCFDESKANDILVATQDKAKLSALSVPDFVDLFC